MTPLPPLKESDPQSRARGFHLDVHAQAARCDKTTRWVLPGSGAAWAGGGSARACRPALRALTRARAHDSAPHGAQVVVEPHEREALRGHEVRERLASFGDGDQERCVPAPWRTPQLGAPTHVRLVAMGR